MIDTKRLTRNFILIFKFFFFIISFSKVFLIVEEADQLFFLLLSENKCLRRMMGNFRQTIMSNKKLEMRTGVENLSGVIRRRRFDYLGHLWRDNTKVKKEAMRSTLYEQKRGRSPSKTWKRTMEDYLKMMG